MRCPLCTKRAGALKPTKLAATTNLFEHINPEYHAYLKSYANIVPKKGGQTKISIPTKALIANAKEDVSTTESEKNIDLFYDYHHDIKNTYTEEELKDEPKPAQVWVHVACVQFLAELEYEEKTTLIDGLVHLKKERFCQECSICKRKDAGATISCERTECTRLFHPECARRANLVLEIKEVDPEKAMAEHYHPGRRQILVIYCEKHTPPLKIRHFLETKARKEKEEIMKFCRVVERNYQLHGPEQKPAGPHVKEVHDPMHALLAKKKKKKQRQEAAFLKEVEEWKKKLPRTKHLINIKLTGKNSESEELNNNIEKYEVISTEVIPCDPNRQLTPEDDIWKYVTCKGLTPVQKYNRYCRLIAAAKEKEQATKPAKNNKQSDSNNNKYVKTTGTQKNQKFETKIKERQKKIAKANPQPLEPLKSCEVCSLSVIEKTKNEPMTECSACQKSYHLICIGYRNQTEELSDFRCLTCNLTRNETMNPQSLQSCPEKMELINYEGVQLDLEYNGEKPTQQNSDSMDDAELTNTTEKRRNPYVLESEEDYTLNKKVKMDENSNS